MAETEALVRAEVESAPLEAPAARAPRVVIIGAGFGGLTCAKALARTMCEVLLVDRENHHCFQPLLYQVATAALSPKDVAWPVRAILRDQKNTAVLMADVSGVDRRARVVIAGERRIPYDYLVLATGAGHAYFGHDEWAPIAPGLKRIDDATDVRRRLLMAFEKAELTEDEAERMRLLTFAVIGGGPTGVELAGAIAEMARLTLAKDFRRIDPRTARVLLLEAAPRLLGAYPEKLSAYAKRMLEKKGVEVALDTKVEGVDRGGLDTSAGRIDAGAIVWAAGVAASPAAAWLGAEKDRAGRVAVTPELTLPGDDRVYVIGDTAAVKNADGSPVPGLAPAAKQMGAYVAKRIAAELRGERAPERFVYRHQGDLATIGRNAAVVRIGGVTLKGFVGWAFWSLAHVYLLIGARNRLAVAFNWAWDYVTAQRGVRLITRAAGR
ncbi:MAG TPA: NAD(P)/FAD-dependent oxidoreductase [Vitreimonas sp.]|uniref:NAD(P)/FAD-dependent oxidoreductase n=1 Tax=Vitreimonas sp. TaxID=3069702 RepID=UPI002D61B889|nr:NAD(P)/FAD-dependent oxidoreductase [Vitreimonas sp.]HYD89087.1 NAD(P)/FAD-dependent oxidoreductase [Vitreimonas sp.]